MHRNVITLCDETMKFARLKPNFSEWVRAKLLLCDERRKEMDDIAIKQWKETGEWQEGDN